MNPDRTVPQPNANLNHRNLNPAVRLLLVWLFCLCAGHLRAQVSEALLLTAEGKVEVASAGASNWRPGTTNLILHVGDRLRTGLRSRATVRLSNLTVLRVNELTTLQIQPPSAPGKQAGLNLESGSTYFLSRERGKETEFRTPLASGAIRGTEFNLAVAADGRSEVTLIDGAVALANNLGAVELVSGEHGIVEPGQPPRKTPFIEAINIIQWTLYYPGVIDVGELNFSAGEQTGLAASLAAYRSGDLMAARENFPPGNPSLSEAGAIYQAALDLSVGQLAAAQALPPSPQADALRQVIAAVKNKPSTFNLQPSTASQWMAGSYYQQSQLKLEAALQAARNAAAKSPNFGFAWARVAELEFSFGRTAAALEALERGLQLSPRNAQAIALKGFLLAAQNKIDSGRRRGDESQTKNENQLETRHLVSYEGLDSALACFNAAIALDGALGNAWLGRGLCKIRRGDAAGGVTDLQIAATLEPNRAVLRSYLGKAFSNAGDAPRADKELALAKQFDPHDPTAWLYSALLRQQGNEINDAVSDLEKSQDLNDNRKVYRSRLLLDQDRAVRSANLANIYQDAGMNDLSVREASRAVQADYANYSAHQFLANSYDALRDPKNINLRYESPWLGELLLANLLSPVGAGNLSTHISQQEYSKLFERDRLGGSTLTEYQSSGAWLEQASQFGTFGNSSYALDVDYRTDPGQRPNNDIKQFTWGFKFKQQLTAADSLFLGVQGYEAESGDVSQYYNHDGSLPGIFPKPSAGLRVNENQRPNVSVGYHHEWSPGNHTLFLFSRLDDTIDLRDPKTFIPYFRYTSASGPLSSIGSRTFPVTQHREFGLYAGELQQIFQAGAHSFIVGGRAQGGDASVANTVTNIYQVRGVTGTNPVVAQSFVADLLRFSGYGYYQLQVCDALLLTAGLSYDYLQLPRNLDTSPVTNGTKHIDQVSPKAGLLWKIGPNTHVRASYAQSLGGFSYDASQRLEPTEVGGFNQAFRSIIPESVAGSSLGARFQSAGIGFDHEFKTRTYLGVDAQYLTSDATRTVGAYASETFLGGPVNPISANQTLNFQEQSLTFTVNQLVGREWSFGMRYRISYAQLEQRFGGVPAATPGSYAKNEATLNQLNLFAVYNHPSGFFARAETIWSQQSNVGYTPARPGDEFWQFNIFAGWRFWQRRAEAQVGLLNLGDRDYRLNPLNLYNELPRERTFVARCKIYF